MSEKSVFDSKGIIMTFKLITDSTADLDEEWANAHDVEILGLTIQLDGKTYETPLIYPVLTLYGQPSVPTILY